MNTLQDCRLSPQQNRAWMLRNSSGESYSGYLVHGALLLEGHLDATVLQQVLRDIVNNHEIFRSIIHQLDGSDAAVQTVIPASDSNSCWPGLKLQHAEDQDWRQYYTDIEQHLSTESSLTLQTTLVRFSSRQHLLVVGLSPLISDRVGFEKLIQLLADMYWDRLTGNEMPRDVLQYSVIAEWQNQCLAADSFAVGRKYWQSLLTRYELRVPLPFELPAKKADHFEPERMALPIGIALWKKITNKSSKHNVPASSFLLYCWQILLSRIAARKEFL